MKLTSDNNTETILRWSVSDFKGLKQGTLELSTGVLTVLAGANSSGKSSLIQSILLSAQSLHQPGPIVLNGPLTRLGEAADLVRDGAESTSIKLHLPSGSSLLESNYNYSQRTGSDLGLDVTLTLRAHPDTGLLALHSVHLVDVSNKNNELLLSKENGRSSDIKAVAQIIGAPDADILHLKSILDSDSRQLRTYVAFSGLTPLSIVRLTTDDQILKDARRHLANSLVRPPNARVLDEAGIAQSMELFYVEQELEKLLHIGKASGPLGQVLDDLYDHRNEEQSLLAAWFKKTEEEQKAGVDALASIRSKQPFTQLNIRRAGQRSRMSMGRWDLGLLEASYYNQVRQSVDALALFGSALEELGQRVQYLGPLRDEPRVVWTQWNEQARGLPVGARGEYSAAVLSRRANRQVAYAGIDGEPKKETLNFAVNEWLSYLQIGQSVSATSRGKLGVGVEINIDGGKRDLTSVGVGVSQALPLIVAMLSAPAKSIFLVEQPELHLHPAVQARLADFMVKSRPDMAVVVETHSETFLTRLRRRVAEDKLEPDRVRVTFVENHYDGSMSRELLLSKYGDLSDWPAGFLTDDEDDTGAIIKANIHRMRTKTS
jgi:predicted ATPase